MQSLNIPQGDYLLSLSQVELRLLLSAVDTKIDTCQELDFQQKYIVFADLREQLIRVYNGNK